MANSGQQLAIRAKGSVKCCHHKTENVIFVCKESGCAHELACITCVTTVHKKHDLEQISTVIGGKKDRIRQYISSAEQQELANIELVIQATELQLTKNSEKFKSIEDRMKKHAQECKDQIDKFMKEFVSKCSQVEAGNKETLAEYKRELQKTKALMNDRITQCKSALQKGTDVEIYDMEMDIVNSKLIIPDTPALSVGLFVACPGYNLESAFGEWKGMDGKYQGQIVIS